MRDETGSVSAEYGVLLAGIAAIIIFAVFALGTQIAGLYTI